MNSHARTYSSLNRPGLSRGDFTPLLRRSTEAAFARSRVDARGAARRSRKLISPDALMPLTPSLVERWWDPHLVDRLQSPLTRYRD